MDILVIISAILMLVSGITHIVQIFFYEKKYYNLVPAIAGVIYLLIGIFLFFESRTIFWVGAIVPFLGGLGGIYRYIKFQKSNFIIFHVLVDIFVVFTSVYKLIYV